MDQVKPLQDPVHCIDQLASSPCDYKQRYITLPRRSIVVIAIPFVQVVTFVVYVLWPWRYCRLIQNCPSLWGRLLFKASDGNFVILLQSVNLTFMNMFVNTFLFHFPRELNPLWYSQQLMPIIATFLCDLKGHNFRSPGLQHVTLFH